MNQPVVRLEQIDGVAVLTVDNPPVNTLSIAVREDLMRGWTSSRRHRPPRRRADLRGQDLLLGRRHRRVLGPAAEEAEYRALFDRIEALPVPVVAAMHGR